MLLFGKKNIQIIKKKKNYILRGAGGVKANLEKVYILIFDMASFYPLGSAALPLPGGECVRDQLHRRHARKDETKSVKEDDF